MFFNKLRAEITELKIVIHKLNEKVSNLEEKQKELLEALKLCQSRDRRTPLK
jgi:hypothetical protein